MRKIKNETIRLKELVIQRNGGCKFSCVGYKHNLFFWCMQALINYNQLSSLSAVINLQY